MCLMGRVQVFQFLKSVPAIYFTHSFYILGIIYLLGNAKRRGY